MSQRREFLKNLAFGTGALASTQLFSSPLFAASAKKAGGLKKLTAADLVVEGAATAGGLHYCANPDKDAKNCEERKDPSRKSQFCVGCSQYTAAGSYNGVEAGKCAVIADPPDKYVMKTGWCAAWSAK